MRPFVAELVFLTTWCYQLWCSVANDLEVGLLQSSRTVAVTYTSRDILRDFLTSKLFTDACIFTVHRHRL